MKKGDVKKIKVKVKIKKRGSKRPSSGAFVLTRDTSYGTSPQFPITFPRNFCMVHATLRGSQITHKEKAYKILAIFVVYFVMKKLQKKTHGPGAVGGGCIPGITRRHQAPRMCWWLGSVAITGWSRFRCIAWLRAPGTPQRAEGQGHWHAEERVVCWEATPQP